VVQQHERASDEAGEQADGPIDALAAQLEVAEAAQLERAQVLIWES
jgi:hypothetical protein